MVQRFRPVLDELEDELSVRLGRPVRVDFVMYSYNGLFNAVIEARLDFAHVGPATYVLLRKRDPGVELLLSELAEAPFVGAIFTRPDSGITSLSQLGGRSLALGDRASTLGNYYSKVELLRAGIHKKDLRYVKHHSSHQDVVEAVQRGEFDVGAANYRVVSRLAPAMKVIHRFEREEVSRPWIKTRRLDAKTAAHLRDSMLALNGNVAVMKPILDHLTGFRPVTDPEYDRVRRVMEEAEAFGSDAADN